MPDTTTSTQNQQTTDGRGSALVSDNGRTTIADTVVAKIAGMAAREVNGVHQMGGGAARAFGGLKERISGETSTVSQGVAVEVGERQAAVDMDIVVEYGVSIVDVANSVRRNVKQRLERMTGLEVTEVNITVDDIWLGELEGEQQQKQQQRVQ